MKIENGKIVEVTKDELFHLYLKRGMDEVMSYYEYRDRMIECGCKVVEDSESAN